MDPDQEICLCFHVTRRKVESFIRIEKPKRAAQLADCFGAGTGCGWCQQYLVAFFEAAAAAEAGEPRGVSPRPAQVLVPAPGEYAEMRSQYRHSKRKGPDSGSEDDSGPEEA